VILTDERVKMYRIELKEENFHTLMQTITNDF